MSTKIYFENLVTVVWTLIKSTNKYVAEVLNVHINEIYKKIK